MKNVVFFKIILLSLIAIVLAVQCTNLFYQWTIRQQVTPLLLVEVTTVDMAKDFFRFLTWFGALLIPPLFASQLVREFSLKRRNFPVTLLSIESVLFIYSFGLSDDLVSGLYFFAFCQLLALVNGIAIYKSIPES